MIMKAFDGIESKVVDDIDLKLEIGLDRHPTFRPKLIEGLGFNLE